MTSGTARIGIAGWVYAPWRGQFYPQGLVQKNELAYASERLGIIEINATFRANQKPASFIKWSEAARDGFMFAVKGPQIVTHIKRLKDCEGALANFFASGPLALGEKLGPFIWQLPPHLKYDEGRLREFLALLPRTAEDYVALAGKSTSEKSEPFLDSTGVGPIRHAIEVRHDSFNIDSFRELLAEHNVAQVIADTPDFPQRLITADFVYCRLQGPPRPDANGYTEADLDAWAEDIAGWTQAGRDVFAFFVHEDKLHAPENAMAVIDRLGIAPRPTA